MKKFLVIGTALVAPAMAMAQDKGLAKVLDTVGDLLSTLSTILFAAAVVAFFYGVARFIFSAGNDKEDGKKVMWWGIIGIFVMASVFGLVNILQDTFVDGNGDSVGAPTLPGLGTE